MNFLYLNLFINVLVLLKQVLCEHYVEIPYISPTLFMETRFQFNDEDSVLLPVNLINDFSWITKTSFFHINESQIIDETQTITIGIKQHPVQTYKTPLGISVNHNTKIEPIVEGFHIYIAGSPSFRIYQLGISFAHKFVHPSFSLVNLLYEQKKINERSFNVVPNRIHKNGTIYIGQIPPDISIRKFNKGTCKVLSDNRKWKCKLKDIQIGNSMLNLTSNEQMNVEFQTSISRILVPQKIVDFFKQALKPFISDEQCAVSDITQSGQWILDCKTDIINKLPNFILTIDNYTYSIPFSNFFEQQQSGNSYTSYFKSPYEPRETDNQTVTLGYTFLSLFDIISFNYEQDTIHLYSRTIPITNDSPTYSLLIEPLLSAITILVIIGIVIDLVVKIKTHIIYI